MQETFVTEVKLGFFAIGVTVTFRMLIVEARATLKLLIVNKNKIVIIELA